MRKNAKVYISLLTILSLINLYTVNPPSAIALTLNHGNPSEALGNLILENEDEVASITYGVDADGVPFARRKDGAKARYLSISPKQYKIQISDTRLIGEVLFSKRSTHELIASFIASNNDSLSAHAILSEAKTQSDKIAGSIIIQLNENRASLKTTIVFGEKGDPVDNGNNMQAIVNRVNASQPLTKLLSMAKLFSRVTVVKHAFTALAEEEGCGWAVTSCVASLIEYGLGIALITEVCGVTFGLGCLGALVLHPLAGVMVGKHCSDAITACGLGEVNE